MTRAVIASILLACAAAAAPAQQTFRTGIELVHFPVVVTDKQGVPVTGLTADDFEILEEGRRQTIRYFAEGDPEEGHRLGEVLPLHLGLAIDTSGSMERDIGAVRTAVIKFLNANEAAVDVTLVDFDTEVRMAQYAASEYPRLIERIRMRRTRGWTALYDALGTYLSHAAGQPGQKILLLYTDGGDTRSALTYSGLMDLLKASDVTLYIVGYLENQPSSARNQQRMQLRHMAEVTGGQAFFPTSMKELDRIYDGIQAEIAARYSLGYVSSNTRMDGTWRRVDVRLKRSDLRGARLRTRTGYFALYRDRETWQ